MERRAAGIDEALKAPKGGRAVWKVVCMVAIDSNLNRCFEIAKRRLPSAYIALFLFLHSIRAKHAGRNSSFNFLHRAFIAYILEDLEYPFSHSSTDLCRSSKFTKSVLITSPNARFFCCFQTSIDY